MLLMQLVFEWRNVRRRYQQLHLPVPREVCWFQLPDALVAV